MYLLMDLCHCMDLVNQMVDLLLDVQIACMDFRRQYELQRGRVNRDDGVIGIILTNQMLQDVEFMYYLEKVHELCEDRKMCVVTALKDLNEDSLPERAQWLRATDIVSLQRESDQYVFCYHCIKKSLH
ncbi:MAG: hypothetical protein PHW47_10710 [Lachnospira sp.]|nr:hypothetical protein [Lachnospira sp.]